MNDKPIGKLDDKRACRIKFSFPGGFRSPESEWDSIHAKLVDAMNRLDGALGPSLKKLNIS
jgi:hypothetical protein